MSTRVFGSAAAGDGLGAGSGAVWARADIGTAATSDAASRPHASHRRLASFVLTITSLPKSARMGHLPRPHPASPLVEQPLVVALAQLLARLGRELREKRRVHVVDL